MPIILALQGGGSLGAFSWGVIERLLDQPHLRIEMVSGASAGAMNAALLVQGLATGGPEEAKRLLEAFWRRVANAAGSTDSDAMRLLFPLTTAIMAPMMEAMRATTRQVARHIPAAPLATNPLAGVLEGLLDPGVFGQPGTPTLVVSATTVRTGEARLFRDAEVTVQALLASACLPNLFPTVEIDGEAYWDGGFVSNPPLRALIEADGPTDVLIVRTSPIERPAPEAGDLDALHDRTRELTFGTALRRELESVATAQALLADQEGATGVLARLRDARLHMIGAEDAFNALPGGSGSDASWAFLSQLRELGHRAADAWIAEHAQMLGVRSTIDLSRFAAPRLTAAAG